MAGCGAPADRLVDDDPRIPSVILAPDLTLDEAGGASFGELGDLVELPDGSLAVADHSERRVLHLDSVGRILHVWGRPGRGPGEFQRISRLWRLGTDSLLVHDFFSRRLTVIDITRGVVAHHVVEVPPGYSGFATPVGATGVGYVLRGGPAITPADPPVLDRSEIALYVMRSDTLQSVLQGYRGPEAYRGTGRDVTQLPTARNTLFFVAPDRVYSLDTVEDTVRVWALSGGLIRAIPLGITPRPMTDEAVGLDRRYRIAENRRLFTGQGVPESFIAGREAVLSKVPYPPFWPTASELLVDDSDRLWVRRDISQALSANQSWEVYSSGGELLARFSLTGVERIGIPRRDRFWAVQHDSIGVPRLTRYTVTIPPARKPG